MERIGYTIFYSHNINLFIHVKKKKERIIYTLDIKRTNQPIRCHPTHIKMRNLP